MNELNFDSATPVNTAALNSAAASSSSKELDQSDFMELLVAQMKNQDPSKPLEPSQFMNQLAQFSTVNGVQELKTAFDALATKLSSDQSLQAANLVGRDVLIPGNSAALGNGGNVSGQVMLQDRATDLTLKVFNSRGEQVRNLPMGSYNAGPVQFQWDGFADDGSAASPGAYHVVAEAMIGGNAQAVEIQIENRIDSITLNQDGSGLTLNLASGESVPLSQVQQIK
ncbi:MAG: flagellar hook assembly protein FlgD [Gammaproteobacteria bacterium]